MSMSIVERYRNRVEPWKRKALTQKPMRPDQLVREDWDRAAFEALLFAKLEFINETLDLSTEEANELYVEVFDIFALSDEFVQLRQWLFQPLDTKTALSQRLEATKVHIHELHRRSIEGDDSPAIQLAFMIAQQVLADVDKARRRFEALQRTDDEIYRECFVA